VEEFPIRKTQGLVRIPEPREQENSATTQLIIGSGHRGELASSKGGKRAGSRARKDADTLFVVPST